MMQFLYKWIQKLTTDYNLESVSGNINSIKNEIAELQQCLLSIRIRNEIILSKKNQCLCKMR